MIGDQPFVYPCGASNRTIKRLSYVRIIFTGELSSEEGSRLLLFLLHYHRFQSGEGEESLNGNPRRCSGDLVAKFSCIISNAVSTGVIGNFELAFVRY